MATVTQTVCDLCGKKEREASTYSIEGGGRRATVDLCEEDAAQIEVLLTRFAVGRKKRVTRTRSTESYEGLRASSIEDVEAAQGK